jgi:hypothetical protein
VTNLLLDAGPGGLDGGMSAKKHIHITGASRARVSLITDPDVMRRCFDHEA